MKKDIGYLLTLQICIPWRYHVWGRLNEAILKRLSEAQNSFWIKSRIGEDTRQFFAGPINKAVPSFKSVLTEYANGDGRHSEHFSLH